MFSKIKINKKRNYSLKNRISSLFYRKFRFNIQAVLKAKLRFLFDNFLAIVRTALLANSVREHEFTALGAFYDAGKAELPVV
jgi:hypothetical protein